MVSRMALVVARLDCGHSTGQNGFLKPALSASGWRAVESDLTWAISRLAGFGGIRRRTVIHYECATPNEQLRLGQ